MGFAASGQFRSLLDAVPPSKSNIGVAASGIRRNLRFMDWQEVVSLTIVAVTTGMFLWRRGRRRKFNFQRDTHCGCSSISAPPPSVTYRARKGAQPEVIVKMR